MKSKILICDYVHSSLIKGLETLGFQVVYAPEIHNDQVEQWLPHMEGIVVNTRTPVRKKLMEKCPGLNFIGRLGIGLDIFDLDEAERRGIRIMNTPGANANAVGEHMFGMLLALLRKIPMANASVKDGHWLREKHRGREVKDLTIGIIGFGNTGRAFASKFANWMTKVVSYDKYKTRYAEDMRFVEESTLERVLAESDVISFHVPLTKETHGMANAEFLAKCKSGVVLLNGSRGKVVQNQALLEALNAGQVSGACLDVLENEKIETLSGRQLQEFEALTVMEQVIMSPHIAGWTHASKKNIAMNLLGQVEEMYDAGH